MHSQQLRHATQHPQQQPLEAHMQRPQALRRLMETTDAPYSNITVVHTALELQNAVRSGAGYIELRDHVDLSTIDAVEIPSATPNLDPEPSHVLLGEIPKAVLSIRGNCPNPPTTEQLRTMSLEDLGGGAPLLPFLPGQCLLVGNRKFLDTFRGTEEGDTSAVTNEWHRLWLDNLYMRYKKTTSAPEGYVGGLVSLTSSSEVWMTYMTLQGDGKGRMECGTCGVRAGGTSLYAEGCTFADFEGDMVMHTNTRATTALLGCRFLHNVGTPLGVLNAKSETDSTGALVRIERCTFANNTGPHLLQMMRWVPEARPAFYTDTRMHVFRNGTQISKPTDEDGVSLVDTVGEASQPLADYPDRHTISGNSEWFEQLQQAENELGADVHESLLDDPSLMPTDVPSRTDLDNNTAYDAFIAPLYPDFGGSPRRAAIIGGSCAAAVVLSLLVAVLVLRFVRRRNARRERDLAAATHKDAGAVESRNVPEDSADPPSDPPHQGPDPGNKTITGATKTTETTVDVTNDTSLPFHSAPPPVVPASSANLEPSNLNLNSNYKRSSSLLINSDATHVTNSTTRASSSSTFTNSNTTAHSTSTTHATVHTLNDDASAMHAMTSDFAPDDAQSQAPFATGIGSTHEVPTEGVATGGIGPESGQRGLVLLGVPKPPRTAPPCSESVLRGDAQEPVATSDEGGDGQRYSTNNFSMGVALPRTAGDTVDSRAAQMHDGQGSNAFSTAHVHASYDVTQTHAQPSQSMAVWRTMAAHYGTQATFDASTGKASPRISALPPVSEGGTLDRENLEKELDEMSASGELFLGQFELLGARNRRQGGQGVVQFARSAARCEHSTESVAIKFFLNRNAFDCEEALYMRPELRGMMPAISMLQNNESGVAATSQGGRFPPFIVVERGESLDEWQRRIQPDFPTIVQVLSHVTDRVKTLHALGVAHRDLKPGNVLWRPLEHSWTLIDFGCAAEIGVTTRLTFTPAYAPPETLQALADGNRTTEATAAADVWVIGVIAFELATKHAAFPSNQWKYDDIISAARGEVPYPWEEQPGTFRNAPELRILGGVVRECLCRTPSERPSAAAVLGKLNSLFDSGS